jgi:murein DD-endopeptidase MepM/ murein hydrolase activator NlpD
MNTQHQTIQIKDKAVAIGIAALALVAVVFVYRSAADRHELERLRDQNRVLSQQINHLSDSFASIHRYTKSANELANGELAPAKIRTLDDTQEFSGANANEQMSLFGRVSLAAKSGPAALRPSSDLEGFTSMLGQIDDLNRDTDSIVRRLRSLATILKYNKDLIRSIPTIKPAEGRIASEFGMRLSPFEGKRHFHAGLDIAAIVGSDVIAPADGVVTFVGDFESLGRAVVISHSSGVMTRYGHLSGYKVKQGDRVKRGQIIAKSGNTGRSTGPHVHYEVWVKNIAVNPRDFFFDMADQTELLVAKTKSEHGKVALTVQTEAQANDAMGGEEDY